MNRWRWSGRPMFQFGWWMGKAGANQVKHWLLFIARSRLSSVSFYPVCQTDPSGVVQSRTNDGLRKRFDAGQPCSSRPEQTKRRMNALGLVAWTSPNHEMMSLVNSTDHDFAQDPRIYLVLGFWPMGLGQYGWWNCNSRDQEELG